MQYMEMKRATRFHGWPYNSPTDQDLSVELLTDFNPRQRPTSPDVRWHGTRLFSVGEIYSQARNKFDSSSKQFVKFDMRVQFNCLIQKSDDSDYGAVTAAFPGVQGHGLNPAAAANDLIELMASRLGDSPCIPDNQLTETTLIQGEIILSILQND